MSNEGASPDEHQPSDTAAPQPDRPWMDRTRLARMVALAGVLVAVLAARSFFLPHVPVDHDVELQLETPKDVVRLDVRWSAPGSDDDLATSSLRFPPGQAPTAVRANVRLPEGTYDVAIAVERTSGADSTRRRIELRDDSRVTIPLR